METSLSQSFMFQGQEVRTIIINDEVWFIASDVCATLEHSNVSVAVDRLDEDEKLIQAMFISGQHRQTWLVNEPGIYHLIFTSRIPKAKEFRHWIFHEVIPTLRKTGSYTIQTPKQLPTPVFKSNDEAWNAEPRCPCPSPEQVRT